MDSAVVTEALQKGRFPEIVEITTTSADELSTEEEGQDQPAQQKISLVACLDRVNGGTQWNPILQNNKEFLLQCHLQTKRWILPMLNDRVRNEQYQRAIQAAVARIIQHDTKDKEGYTQILDIGSGTGLLGMLACQAFLKHPQANFQVMALEMASSMVQIAQQTVRDNRLDKYMTVTEGHSCDPDHDLLGSSNNGSQTPTTVLCVSELLEHGLLGEGILPALRDVWERHAAMKAKNPQNRSSLVMVPRRARVYARVVQGEWMEQMYGLRSDHDTEASLNWSVGGGQALFDPTNIQIPIHANKLLQEGSLIYLTDTIKLLDFDFSTKDSMPGPTDGWTAQSKCVQVTEAGHMHAILVWWELDIWDNVTYSTEPGKQPWQDHWQAFLHLLPDGQDVAEGDSVTLHGSHSDDRLFVSVKQEQVDGSNERQSKKARSENNPATLEAPSTNVTPFRAGQLHDRQRIACWRQAIDCALSAYTDRVTVGDVEREPLVLDLADFGVGACLAASLGAKHVISVESCSDPELVMTAARVAQLGNGFPRLNCKFELLQCHYEQLSLDVLGGRPADIVLGGEYTQVLEGWHWQEALNFFYTLQSLRSRDLITQKTNIVPARCRIMGCAVESSQLRSAYKPCGDDSRQILGLDHSYINNVGGDVSKYDLCLPMWQYDYREISEQVELTTLNFKVAESEPGKTKSQAKFILDGQFDAILYWVEYDFDNHRGADKLSFSGKGQSSLQLVRMMQPSIAVKAGMSVMFEFSHGIQDAPTTHTIIASVHTAENISSAVG